MRELEARTIVGPATRRKGICSTSRHRVSRCSAATLLAAAALAQAVPARGAATERIEVVVAVDGDGRATPLWSELLARRLPAPAVAEAVAAHRPLEPAQLAWIERIQERSFFWHARMPELVALFAPVEPPPVVRVVLGNRAGEDAFTHDPTTVGFDVARLAALYGEARSEENADRIDRLFLHEYTHLLQKAWLPDHPQPTSTPFERAELEIWKEGLGNYRSMSARWRATRGEHSGAARAALDRLEPRFVERMVALACATAAAAERLTADLSMGPFDEKWGALTAALWLEQEASVDPGALRRFVQGGTAEVLELARRHLAARQFTIVEGARDRSRRCHTPGGSPP